MNGRRGSAAPIEGIGERPVRRATRALLLSAASRLVVLVLVVGAAVLWVSGAGGAIGDRHGTAAPVLVPDPSDVDARGHAVTEVLRALEAVAGGPDLELVTVELGRPAGRRAPLSLRVEVSEGSDAISGMLASVERAGIEQPFVRSVAAVPRGVLADVTGEVMLSVARLPSVPLGDVPLTVRLAEEVERSGAVLRRLEAEQQGERAVRLEVDGPPDVVLELLEHVEREHAAPVRFASVMSRAIGPDERRLAVVFVPRGA